jgi:hypothetical protein
MRYFLGPRVAEPLLADGTEPAPVERLLVPPTVHTEARPASSRRAGRRAVPVPAIAGPAQNEVRPAQGAAQRPERDHAAPPALVAMDFSDGPCERNEWLARPFTGRSARVAGARRASQTTTPAPSACSTPRYASGQETRATPRSSRSETRASGRSLPLGRSTKGCRPTSTRPRASPTIGSSTTAARSWYR